MTMLHFIARNWWLLVVRGACAILFGVLAFAWPGVTLGALVLLWGVYALVGGVLSLMAAFSGAAGRPWWALTLEGVVSIAAAAAAFFFPGLTAVVLLYLIAAWAVVTGVFEIVAAIQLRKVIENELWLGLAGVASVLFGVLLFASPAGGALAVIWMIAAYAIVFGVLLVGLGLRVRARLPA
jgi:uncharacterized membrane protein HdeD (DUF308 family)